MNKKGLALGAKLLVSGGLIFLLFRDVELAAAWQRVTSAHPGLMVLALAILMLQVIVVAWRWKVILDVIQSSLPFPKVFRFFYISAFFNQALPASVGGDAVRVYKAHKAGLSLSAAFNSAVLDRVSALIAVVVMMAALMGPLFTRVDDPALRSGLILMMGGALGGLVVLALLDRLPDSLRHWRVVRGLVALAGDARRVFFDWRRTPWVLVVTLLGHGLIVMAVWTLALALGLDVTALDCLVLFPPVLLISSLPVSIAGWGVREAAMVTAFGFVGVAEAGALVLSIMLGLALIVVNLPGGLLWLTGDRRDAAAIETIDKTRF